MSDYERILGPYLSHPLVERANPNDLTQIDDDDLNEVIRSVDLILRALKENYHGVQSRLNAGNFSSSVLISRGWLFLDNAHSTHDVEAITDRICAYSETTSRKNIIRNVRESTIPRLKKDGLIELDEGNTKVKLVMPYAISSKIFVMKELLSGRRLYKEQINQFNIMGQAQYFPIPTAELKSKATVRDNFGRDYDALTEIDAIRGRYIKGVEYTLAKAYLLNKKSIDIWRTVLETSDPVRMGFKELMEIVGHLGGFASQSEIARMTDRNMRIVNRLIRRADSLGIAQRSSTLDLEDALSRPLETKITFNYHQLDNAQSILTLCRSVPEATNIIHRLQTEKVVNEGTIINEFDAISVGRVRNALIKIGILLEDTEDQWELAPNKEADDFLLEVLSLSGNSRRILGDEIDINHKLAEYFKEVDDSKLQRVKEEAEKDYLDELGRESL